MCDFIENYGETMFLTYYETYHRLVEDYGRELVDNFANHFDVDTIPHFEEMYQGQHETGGNFAEYICEELGYIRDLPSWVAVDWKRLGKMHSLTITQKLIVICLITPMVTYSQTIINMT